MADETPFSFAKMRPGSRKARLAEILRVDHAGEYGAVRIYQGQAAIFGATPRTQHAAEVVREMEAGEEEHLATFDRLLNEHQVRPTALAPLWDVAGFALGAGTALLGEKAAMACTDAVEEVIEQHYAAQIDELAEDEPDLADTLRAFREDEIAHRDQAKREGAEQAPGYGPLRMLIQGGCKIAIKLSEKI